MSNSSRKWGDRSNGEGQNPTRTGLSKRWAKSSLPRFVPAGQKTQRSLRPHRMKKKTQIHPYVDRGPPKFHPRRWLTTASTGRPPCQHIHRIPAVTDGDLNRLWMNSSPESVRKLRDEWQSTMWKDEKYTRGHGEDTVLTRHGVTSVQWVGLFFHFGDPCPGQRAESQPGRKAQWRREDSRSRRWWGPEDLAKQELALTAHLTFGGSQCSAVPRVATGRRRGGWSAVLGMLALAAHRSPPHPPSLPPCPATLLRHSECGLFACRPRARSGDRQCVCGLDCSSARLLYLRSPKVDLRRLLPPTGASLAPFSPLLLLFHSFSYCYYCSFVSPHAIYIYIVWPIGSEPSWLWKGELL